MRTIYLHQVRKTPRYDLKARRISPLVVLMVMKCIFVLYRFQVNRCETRTVRVESAVPGEKGLQTKGAPERNAGFGFDTGTAPPSTRILGWDSELRCPITGVHDHLDLRNP